MMAYFKQHGDDLLNSGSYQDRVARLRREVSDLRAVATQWMTWIAIAVTFFVVWIAVVYAAILVVAVRWLRAFARRA